MRFRREQLTRTRQPIDLCRGDSRFRSATRFIRHSNCDLIAEVLCATQVAIRNWREGDILQRKVTCRGVTRLE